MLKLKCSPLDLRYDELTHELFFEGRKLAPQVRLLGQVYDVLYDKLFAAVADQKMPLYYMYRGVARKRDEEKIKKSGLRFDVTVMPALVLGREFNKTFGHYHEPVHGTFFPELYEVLRGQVHFLLHKKRAGSNDVEEVRLVKAREADKIIIPPEFGHIAINPSKTKALVTIKASERSFSNNYRPFIEKKGGAYYELVDGFAPNPSYENPPKIKVLKPVETRAFPKKKCIYRIFLEDPGRLRFLTSPSKPAAVKP